MELHSALTPSLPPVWLDGLDGQEDELEDVHRGELEPRPHDDSSGDRAAPRPPRPSGEVEEEEREEPVLDIKPVPEIPDEDFDDIRRKEDDLARLTRL